ncbi:uncharacterized protein K441DRAFT_689361 [Cenococcum geophilum 1.58]|uniref:uncharacterized protein n=1 Tax=Cenococcum geophilum 1.58 TaxID=794803 RepID=UPI00358EBE88|nr:hypothetical protein K441DRAFT_689361 [Cenococcum geophilum 1.58]
MGQIFYIACPSAQEVLPAYGKLGEFLFSGSPRSIVEVLAVPVRPVILALAAELHYLIFEKLDITDSIGRRHIQTYFMSFLGPWAGKRILCVGDYVEAGDHPPGLFTEDEERSMENKEKEEERPMTLANWAYVYATISVKFPTTLFTQLLSKNYYKQYCRMSGSDRSEVRKIVNPEFSQFYPKDQPWILRNLKTREYVRSDAIALRPEYIHGPNIDVIGFGEVVLSRICWSSDPSVNIDGRKYNRNIHRGIWAGHCFDITTRAQHEERVNEEWKDVSEEVAKEIANIWESEYGDDWRRIVMEGHRH